MAEQEQPKRPKPTKEALLASAPWLPPKWELADASALQAMARGEADPVQQQRAIKWIIEAGAGTYDMSYHPGEEGRRDTDFAEGRRFVGAQIVKLLKVSLAAMARRPGSDAPEQR